MAQALDPVSAAREQLFFWSAPTDPPDDAAQLLLQRFGDRYAKALDATGQIDATGQRLTAALGALYADDVPALAAAPLAVMAAMDVSPANAFNPPLPYAVYIPPTDGGFDQTEF